MNTRDRFSPEVHADDGPLGLLRSFRMLMEQGSDKGGIDRGPAFADEPTYTPSSYQAEPMGLIGRLQALQQAQNDYQPKQPAMDPRKYELAQAITNASRNLGIDEPLRD
ncbi:hypothetical protein J6500_08370 [Bradyrhizobium sp. WSM 1704]|uniref:hypothetical protein n=1 Tax=Bradyrhizobium semiaridum TaxID=2821404 RepID=UPI001CE3AAF1|nr:hypothetical protein [Bradyrhizobium semiaridum]MCA6121913.1 hypothetical protein [Bradyrhizobium semiaridum]